MENIPNPGFEFAKQMVDALPLEQRSLLYLEAFYRVSEVAISYAAHSQKVLELATSIPPHLQDSMSKTIETFVEEMVKHFEALSPPVV